MLLCCFVLLSFGPPPPKICVILILPNYSALASLRAVGKQQKATKQHTHLKKNLHTIFWEQGLSSPYSAIFGRLIILSNTRKFILLCNFR